MFRKIFFYVLISLGIFLIIGSLVIYLSGGSINDTFIILLAGLIPIFIAFINRASDDITKKR